MATTFRLRESAHASLGRYPGPVWMLAAWALLAGANLGFAVALPANHMPPTTASTVTGIYALLAFLLLLALGQRTPTWLLWTILTLAIGTNNWLILDARTQLGDALFAFTCTVYCMWVSLWGSGRVAWLYWAAMAASFLAILAAKGDLPYMLVSWLTIMTICALLTALLTYLMRHIDAMLVRLDHLASSDALTGLLNRRGVEALLQRQEGEQRGEPRAVVIIDLDGLKEINDLQGHEVGDEHLLRLATDLRGTLRDADLAVRIGGDEFMLVLPNTTVAEAERRMGQLRASASSRWSYGIAAWPKGEDLTAAMKAADHHMFTDKARRRSERQPEA